MSRTGAWVSVLLMCVLVAGSWLVLPEHGIAWDEGLGDLFFGHRNLAGLGGDATALDFERRHALDGDGHHHPDLYLSPLRDRPWEHFPVMATLSALSCEVGWRRLALLDPVDAHHLAGVLALALLVPFLIAAAEREWSLLPAVAAALAVLLHPRMLAAAWIDLKDTGAAVFGTIALLMLWRALRSNRDVVPVAAALLAAALASGLALGSKLNVVFLPVPVLAFWLIARPSLPRLRRGVWLAALTVGPVLAIAVVLWLWPWLRADPIEHAAQSFGYVFGRGATGSKLPNALPAITLLISWPVGTLALVLAGAGIGIADLRARRASLAGLAGLAALFPLARLSAPGVLSFDGFRHGLELLPAAGLLAGAGAARLLAVRGRWPKLLLVAMLIEPAIELYASHPHQIAHANAMVGGLSGARRIGVRGMDDYWATGYRRAWDWINAHAEPGATVAAGVAEHLLVIEGRMRLRPDLRLLRASHPFQPDPGAEVNDAFFAAAERGPVYLVYITRSEWYGPITRAAEGLPAAWSEGPAVAPLLRIVRFAPGG